MVNKHNFKKRLKQALIVIAVFFLVGLLSFSGYFIYSYFNSIKAEQSELTRATAASEYSYKTTRGYISLLPNRSNGKAVIVYPGAFAEPEGYVVVFKKLAEQGTTVFIVKSPLNFALLDVGVASKVFNDHPDFTNWYVAGHSLGGVAACEFAKGHQAELKGLILLASYCNGDGKKLNLPVLSVSASKDGLTEPKDVESSRNKLPNDTKFVVISGGNHTQFGAFQRLQPGDNAAEISQSEQTSEIVAAINEFIK